MGDDWRYAWARKKGIGGVRDKRNIGEKEIGYINNSTDRREGGLRIIEKYPYGCLSAAVCVTDRMR
jgi:hypothetical protein